MPSSDAPLRFADRYTHLVRTPEALVLVEDSDWLLIDNGPLRSVLERINGVRTAMQLASVDGGLSEAAEMHYLVRGLLREGVLIEAGASREPTDPGHRSSRPEQARPDVELVTALTAAWQGCREGFVEVSPEVWGRPLGARLLLTDDYLRPGVQDWMHGQPRAESDVVLLARVGESEAWIGPLISERAVCFWCLRRRIALNHPARVLLYAERSGTASTVSDLTPTGRLMRRSIAAIARRLPADRAGLERIAFGVTRTGNAADQVHPVRRLPDCVRCGDAEPVPGASLRLQRKRPLDVAWGGYRTTGPAETWQRVSRHVDPVTGIVRRVARVDVPHPGIHVYTASHVLSEREISIASLRSARRDQGGGKGRDDLDARVSAVCECLERFSSIHRGTEPTVLARASELDETVWQPSELLCFSERQFAEREDWNAAQHGPFQLVPEPYDDRPIEWAEVRELGSREVHLVPAAYVYSSFRGEGAPFCRADSNGLSAGNCLEEAIVQGFFELVERDAIALWWYNRVRRPEVDLRDVDDRWVASILDAHDALDRNVWVLDLTTDLGIPVLAALSARRGAERPEIVFGFGSHVDVHRALGRALAELSQMLPSVLQTPEARARQLLPDFADAIRWWEETTSDDVVHLVPKGSVPQPTRSDPRPQATDLHAVVADCVARVERRGMRLLVHELTRPDVGMPVARVIVPGLRHFWRRLGPGRLYDVPVELGWIADPRDEANLNPVSLFV